LDFVYEIILHVVGSKGLAAPTVHKRKHPHHRHLPIIHHRLKSPETNGFAV